jgi:hypothetical protein
MFDAQLKILPDAQRELWPRLVELPSQFTLYGGTAVALRLGHRSSVDFDFFTDAELSESFKGALLRLFEADRSTSVLQNDNNTLSFTIESSGAPVKLSFFGGLSFGRVDRPERTSDGVACVAGLLDLFGHKLKVLHDRAEGKDYEDIAALLGNGVDLSGGLAAFEALFGRAVPPAVMLKALTYFDDVNESWRLTPAMKVTLANAVRSLAQTWPSMPVASRSLGCGDG